MGDVDAAFDGLGLTTGVVRYNDLCYVLAEVAALRIEGASRAAPYLRLRPVGAESLDWTACSGTVCHSPAEKFIALGNRVISTYSEAAKRAWNRRSETAG